jgi:predicted ester cyclase
MNDVIYEFVLRKPNIFAEGDRVIAHFTVSGTQQGAFLGIPSTGKHATITDIEIVRIAKGKFVEIWVQADFLGLLQQFGVLPAIG